MDRKVRPVVFVDRDGGHLPAVFVFFIWGFAGVLPDGSTDVRPLSAGVVSAEDTEPFIKPRR